MIRAIALALVGIASFGAVYWAMAPDSDDAPAAVSARATLPSAAVREAEAPASAATQPAPAPSVATAASVRNVTPANMTAAPQVTGPLQRVAPSPEPAKPAEAKPARRERLFNPVIVSAGIIKVGDDEIRLAGISATAPERSCGQGAGAWPCGTVARAALRRFVRGRAIECDVPEGAESVPNPARCFVGGDDISEWLVAQGWAEAAGSYGDAAKGARDGKLGLFSPRRPDAQPDELAARR